MTDNEIIKALECCLYNGVETCKGCPMFYTHEFDNEIDFDCGTYIYGRAADLIKRQQAEIEQWKTLAREIGLEKVEHNSLCETETFEGRCIDEEH